MADRNNHYELAFEEFLRQRGVPYVAVDESRRSLLLSADWTSQDSSTCSIKSVDFIVSSSAGPTWLVDVKGRRFPSGRQKQYWKNWSTRDDLLSLTRWEQLFGPHFGGLFVFAYNVVGDRAPLPAEQMFEFRGGLYGFVGVRLEHYTLHARQISPRWDTVAMPAGPFRRFAQPLDELLLGENAPGGLKTEQLQR